MRMSLDVGRVMPRFLCEQKMYGLRLYAVSLHVVVEYGPWRSLTAVEPGCSATVRDFRRKSPARAVQLKGRYVAIARFHAKSIGPHRGRWAAMEPLVKNVPISFKINLK